MNSSLDAEYGDVVPIADPSGSSVMMTEKGGVIVAVIPPASCVWMVGEYGEDGSENGCVSASIMSLMDGTSLVEESLSSASLNITMVVVLGCVPVGLAC